jgi:hypothetical protein
MAVTVVNAIRQLDARGLVRRCKGDPDDAELVIDYVRERLGRPVPQALADLYRERIDSIGQFAAVRPIWNDWVGWRPITPDVAAMLPAQAVPLFWDGCGNLYGMDLSSGAEDPAVYFFDKAEAYERPGWAAGSSIGAFLLLLGEHDAAFEEQRPRGWELAVDPDLGNCPRAPPIWLADH